MKFHAYAGNQLQEVFWYIFEAQSHAIAGCEKQTHWQSKTWKLVLYKKLVVWIFCCCCCFLVMAAFILNAKSSSSILFWSHEFTPAQMAGCLLPNELWIRLIFYTFIYNSPIGNCYFFIVFISLFVILHILEIHAWILRQVFGIWKKSPQITIWLLVRGHFFLEVCEPMLWLIYKDIKDEIKTIFLHNFNFDMKLKHLIYRWKSK